MQIDVSKLLKAPGEKEEVKFNDLIHYEDDAVKIVSPVRAGLRLVNTGRTILLTGTAQMKVQLTCCRCLKPFILPVKLELEEEYALKHRKEEEKVSGCLGASRGRRKTGKDRVAEVELRDEDFVFEIGADNTIDLFEAIRQNLLATIPIKPICNDKCKGLLVPGEVNSGKKAIDPRLKKLEEWKKEDPVKCPNQKRNTQIRANDSAAQTGN